MLVTQRYLLSKVFIIPKTISQNQAKAGQRYWSL